jgi:hypothetical protein
MSHSDTIKHKQIGILSAIILSNAVYAMPLKTLEENTIKPSSWSFTPSIGYTNFNNMYGNEGQTILWRLAFDKDILNMKLFDIGAELGAQNGNSMRLDVSQEDLDILGGNPVQTTVNPIIDLLATLTTKPFTNTPVFLQLKGGIAYRNWQFEDRTSINPLSSIAGELQAGLGFMISDTTKLSILYQGIYGGSSDFIVDSSNETAQISQIPIQNGVLLSMAIRV